MDTFIGHIGGIIPRYAGRPWTAVAFALIFLVQLLFCLDAHRRLFSYVRDSGGTARSDNSGSRAALIVLWVQEILFVVMMALILPDLLSSASGVIGAAVIFLEELVFLRALVALVGASRHYADQSEALDKLVRAGGSQTRGESRQINSLLDEYDRLKDLGVDRPDIDNLVSRYVGNDSRLVLEDDLDAQEGDQAAKRVHGLFKDLLHPRTAPALVRFVLTTMVGIGLFGTFVGFTFTLSDLSGSLESLRVEIVQKGDAGDVAPGSATGTAAITADDRRTIVEQLVDQIRMPLGGMYTAFATSVAGLFLTIMLTLLREVWCNYPLERRLLVQDLRAFLDGEYARRKSTIGEVKPTGLVLELRNLAANLADLMRQGFDSGFARVSQELYTTNAAMGNMITELSRLIGSFNRSAESMLSMTDVLSQFSETNEQGLRRMETVVAESHRDTLRLTSAVQEIAVPIERFSGLVQESVESLHRYEQTIEGFGQEILGVTTAALSDVRRMVQSVMDSQTELRTAVSELPGEVARAAAGELASGLDRPIACLSGSVDTMKVTMESLLGMLARYDESLNSVRAQLESLGRTVADELAATMARRVEGVVDSINNLYGRISARLADGMGAKHAEALEALRAEYERSVRLIDESVKQLQEQAVARLEEATRKLDRQVSQLTAAYRASVQASTRLIRELDRVFALETQPAPGGPQSAEGTQGMSEAAASLADEQQLGGQSAGRPEGEGAVS